MEKPKKSTNGLLQIWRNLRKGRVLSVIQKNDFIQMKHVLSVAIVIQTIMRESSSSTQMTFQYGEECIVI